MKSITGLGLPLSFLSFSVALCCVLPMTMMLFGLGGSWMAVFGQIAGASVPVLTISAILIGIGWLVAISRGTAGRQKWLLGGATALTGRVVYLNESAINTQLIEMML